MPDVELPEPPQCAAGNVRVRIGGTGVVIGSQVLGMAAGATRSARDDEMD